MEERPLLKEWKFEECASAINRQSQKCGAFGAATFESGIVRLVSGFVDDGHGRREFV